MKTERSFNPMTDRYAFDFTRCTADKGFAQVDTGQDASYFGTWANPFDFKIVTYCEGDITIETAESADEFRSALLRVKQFWTAKPPRFTCAGSKSGSRRRMRCW